MGMSKTAIAKAEGVTEKAIRISVERGLHSIEKYLKKYLYLLSGILKCPKCGGPMYTNKHAWTNKDGTYKEIYYYVCSKARTARGKSCDYKAMLKKTDIEPLVIEAIRELKNYEVKLREVDLNKTHL